MGAGALWGALRACAGGAEDELDPDEDEPEDEPDPEDEPAPDEDGPEEEGLDPLGDAPDWAGPDEEELDALEDGRTGEGPVCVEEAVARACAARCAAARSAARRRSARRARSFARAARVAAPSCEAGALRARVRGALWEPGRASAATAENSPLSPTAPAASQRLATERRPRPRSRSAARRLVAASPLLSTVVGCPAGGASVGRRGIMGMIGGRARGRSRLSGWCIHDANRT